MYISIARATGGAPTSTTEANLVGLHRRGSSRFFLRVGDGEDQKRHRRMNRLCSQSLVALLVDRQLAKLQSKCDVRSLAWLNLCYCGAVGARFSNQPYYTLHIYICANPPKSATKP